MWKTFQNLTLAGLLLATGLASCAQDTPVAASKLHGDDESFAFTVTLENLSQNTALSTALAPLAWAVHAGDSPLFQPQQKASMAFAALAEDGDPEVLIDGLTGALSKGHLTEPLAPGATTQFTFDAKPGSRFSFAGMVAETNDVFLGLSGAQVALFDGRNEPLTGDLTLVLYDAGTEVNQAPGQGDAQAPRQAAPNTGDAEDAVIQMLSARSDGFTYPGVGQLFKVTLTAEHEDHEHGEEDHDHSEEDHDH